MVFNQGIFLGILVGVALLWTAGLTFWLVSRERSWKRAVNRAGEADLKKLLAEIGVKQEELKDDLGKLEAVIADIKRADAKHIQKVGLVRFNPFRDTGGNQSFALSFLDEQNTGLVVTGLHARDTTRFYVKDVVKGIGKSELSQEEKQAIEKAISNK